MIRSRFRSFCCLLIVCLTFSSLIGCATSSRSWWKIPNWPVSHRSERQAQKAELADNSATESGVADEPSENPFQPPQDHSTNRSQAVSSPEPKKAELPSRFDSTTMMLIEAEFKDAPQQEREQWFEELRQVPPEMVPRILRMRRLTLQATEPPDTNPDQSDSSASIDTQTPSAQRPERIPARPKNPLNAVAPWEQENSSGSQPVRMTSAEVRQQPVTMTSRTMTEESSRTSDITSESGSEEHQRNYQQALDQLISLTEQKLAGGQSAKVEADQLEYIADHTHLRMLYLMADRQERALEAIPRLSTNEQEFWQQMFWAMSSYFDGNGIPNASDRATHTVSQLTEATTRLREQANLELRNLSFCQKIDGFGVYDRFERDEFRPGQPVLLYAEMRNFLSEPTSNGLYKTVLKSTIEIHRGGSQPGLVTRQEFPPTEDICRNRRLDYFHSYMINIPDRVTVGPHILKLIVEDQINRKVASYTINFMVQ